MSTEMISKISTTSHSGRLKTHAKNQYNTLYEYLEIDMVITKKNPNGKIECR